MKRLSKEQLKQHVELSAKLRGEHELLEAAVAKYNAAVAEAYAALQRVVEEYNEQISKANAFVEEVHDEQQSYYDERSDKWRDESDAGSAYADWMSQWENALEEVEVEEPGEFELSEIDLDAFDQLETECAS
jgi:hypothetical protein